MFLSAYVRPRTDSRHLHERQNFTNIRIFFCSDRSEHDLVHDPKFIFTHDKVTTVEQAAECTLTTQAVGLPEVVQEPVAHVCVQEVVAGEQRVQRLHLAASILTKAKWKRQRIYHEKPVRQTNYYLN